MRQGNRHAPALPPDQHKHVSEAFWTRASKMPPCVIRRWFRVGARVGSPLQNDPHFQRITSSVTHLAFQTSRRSLGLREFRRRDLDWGSKSNFLGQMQRSAQPPCGLECRARTRPAGNCLIWGRSASFEARGGGRDQPARGLILPENVIPRTEPSHLR